jgi:DNA-binding NarL/FixJ family response regulator
MRATGRAGQHVGPGQTTAMRTHETQAAAAATPPAATAVLDVVIADDHPLFRRVLAAAVDRRPGLSLVGEAADGLRALALVERLRPHVAIVDLRMPHLDGLEVCRRVCGSAAAGSTAVVLLTAHEDGTVADAAVEAGAAAYVPKTATQAELFAAVARAARAPR